MLHNNRPPVAAEANCQLDCAPAACAAATTATTASPIAVPAGSITDTPGPFHNAQPVKCARTRSTTVANLDSQPRTVDLATPNRRAIRPHGIPSAADVNARLGMTA